MSLLWVVLVSLWAVLMVAWAVTLASGRHETALVLIGSAMGVIVAAAVEGVLVAMGVSS